MVFVMLWVFCISTSHNYYVDVYFVYEINVYHYYLCRSPSIFAQLRHHLCTIATACCRCCAVHAKRRRALERPGPLQSPSPGPLHPASARITPASASSKALTHCNHYNGVLRGGGGSGRGVVPERAPGPRGTPNLCW